MQFTANGMSGKVAHAQKNAGEASGHKYGPRKWKRHMVERVKENVYCVSLVTSMSVQVGYQTFHMITYSILIGLHYSILHINNLCTILAVNGRWGSFGDYGECTVTCGGGSRSRFRECNNPVPQHGGDDCTVDGSTYIETKTCNENICPPG